MTDLDELRQALAEWDRLTKAATPRPWFAGAESVLHVPVGSEDDPHASEIVAACYRDEQDEAHDADLIVAAVGLAPTVRAILADAIRGVEVRTEPHDWQGREWSLYYDALRLARTINRITS